MNQRKTIKVLSLVSVIIGAAYSLVPNANAKVIGAYEAEFEAESAPWGDLTAAMMNWSCSSQGSTYFSRSATDNKGKTSWKTEEEPNEVTSKGILASDRKFHAKFNADVNNPNVRLEFSLAENCEKNFDLVHKTSVCLTQDEKGNCTKSGYNYERKPTPLSISLAWNCHIDKLPHQKGATVQPECVLNQEANERNARYFLEMIKLYSRNEVDQTKKENKELNGLLNATMLFATKQTKLSGSVKLNDKKLKYIAKVGCESGEKDSMMIHLAGGIRGGGFKSPVFEFLVNGTKVEYSTPNGLIDDEDILVCGSKGKKIDLQSKTVIPGTLLNDKTCNSQPMAFSGVADATGDLKIVCPGKLWGTVDYHTNVSILRPSTLSDSVGVDTDTGLEVVKVGKGL